MFYDLARRFMFTRDAEWAHEFALNNLRRFAHTPLSAAWSQSVPNKPVNFLGLEFKNPVGLAAGLDKNAECIDAFSQMGFGFVEVGTVTPRPQAGNDKPRIFRLPESNAIINRMGFNNKGVDNLVNNVKAAKYDGILGINIGKNKDTPNERAVDDYLICFDKLYDYVDYFTVNVSSPNTPNLRDLQNIDGLRSILIPLIDENKKRSNKPILLKISPDLDNSDILSIVDLIQELKIDGIITTNTTVSREKLKSDNKLKSEKGGLSGAPLRNRSTEVISLIHKYSKGTLPIIGVGGIMSVEDAIEKLNAGASLIQVYTGFIYNGPSFIYKINREIIKSLN